MHGLEAFHVIVLGLWGGVVLVELLYEWGGVAGRLPAKDVAWLHQRTDRFIELPIIALVVVSGLLLWHSRGWSMDLLPKVLFAGGAVAANLGCYVVVERRAKDPQPGHTRSVFISAVIGVPLAAVALYLGGSRAGWW